MGKNKNIEKNEIIPTNNVEKLLKNIMLDNKEILKENKALREKISTLELGNTINNTHNNQQYSINFFLNEKCKNAMNLEDFVEKIKSWSHWIFGQKNSQKLSFEHNKDTYHILVMCDSHQNP